MQVCIFSHMHCVNEHCLQTCKFDQSHVIIIRTHIKTMNVLVTLIMPANPGEELG